MRKYIVIIIAFFFFLVAEPVHGFTFTENPTKIIIPSANISLPVYKAEVAFDTWEVRRDGASYGDLTPLPGNAGNTVIFSHALPSLFGNLSQVKRGDYIHVFTKNDWFVYHVVETLVVEPENTDVIFSGAGHELTLYTCVGDGFTQRFIVKAKPAVSL